MEPVLMNGKKFSTMKTDNCVNKEKFNEEKIMIEKSERNRVEWEKM